MKYNLSISSVTPSSGVHSNTMRPGETGGEAPPDARGIENMFSVYHRPEAGTSNLRSSQIAVASVSGFIESHICQPRGCTFEVRLTCLLILWRKDPSAQRRSCSS